MIIYTKQVCLYALIHHSNKIKTLYIANKSANSKDVLPKDLFHKYHDKIKFLEDKWAKSMCKGANHQGILVEIDDLIQTPFNDIKKSNFILILDGLTDVGNIGAIVRTAYALGVDSIIATGVNNLNMSAITRTSSGAMLDMDFTIKNNILDNINELSQLGFKFYGAMMDGIDINKVEFNQKRVLVLGNEEKGISNKISKKLNQKISIEMKHGFNSLNVNSAGSILIHRMSYAVK